MLNDLALCIIAYSLCKKQNVEAARRIIKKMCTCLLSSAYFTQVKKKLINEWSISLFEALKSKKNPSTWARVFVLLLELTSIESNACWFIRYLLLDWRHHLGTGCWGMWLKMFWKWLRLFYYAIVSNNFDSGSILESVCLKQNFILLHRMDWREEATRNLAF